MPSLICRWVKLAVSSATLVGCAALSACSVTMQATAFEPRSAALAPTEVEVTRDFTLQLDSGYSRRIRAGSTWRLFGHITQGDVYRPIGDVLSVEALNVSEAYLVLDGSTVTGFYLPVEKAFSPLSQKVAFPTKPKGAS